MSKGIQRALDALGLSPWQALAVIAVGAFYVGEMRPKLAAGGEMAAELKAAGGEMAAELKDLNKTVQTLTTKVEVHSVLLATVSEIRSEVRELRDQVAKLQPKTASTH